MASRYSLRAFLFAVRVAFGLDTVMWRFASAAFARGLFGGGGPTGSGGGSNLFGFGGTGGLLGDGSSSTVTSSSSSSNSTSSNSGSLADADSAALGPAFVPTGAAATAGFVICAGSAATADFVLSTRFISSSPGNAGTGSAIYETSSFGFAGMAFDGTAIDCTALPGGALLFVLFGGGGIIAVARVAPSDGSICCLGGGGNGGLLFFATGPLDFCTGAGLAGSQTSAFALAFRRAPFLSLRAAILNISLFPRSKSLAFLLAIRFLIGSSSEEFGSSMISSRFESGSYQPPGGPLFRPRRLFLAGGCLTSGFSRSLVFAWLLEYAQQLVTVLLWLLLLMWALAPC